jgi:hypothetical protein
MPTPIEILLDPISLIILAIYGALMLWEAFFPGRQLPEIKYWRLKGLLAFVTYFFLSSYLPMFINPYLEKYQIFNWTGLGTFWGALVAVRL